MNNILRPDGTYLKTIIEGDNGIWKLIGTDTPPKTWKAMKAVDTFKKIAPSNTKDDDGNLIETMEQFRESDIKYMRASREKIFDLAEKKIIR